MELSNDPIERDLDEQRMRQRRLLRHIPEWITDDRAGKLRQRLSVPESIDRRLAEVEIRRMVDDVWAAMTVDSDLLDRCARSVQATVRNEVMRAAAKQVTDFIDDELGKLTRAAYDAINTEYVNKLEQGEIQAFRALIPLLVLADIYADDGYMDPKIGL